MENKTVVKKSTPETKPEKEVSINTQIIYFLAAFNVIGLAVGSVMGITAVSLGKSFTNEIIMPILSPLLGTDNWKNTRLKIWKFDLGIGLFISELTSGLKMLYPISERLAAYIASSACLNKTFAFAP